ncbi:G-box regulating factor 6 [Striga asiatica]|uniref:G-box regulating factor 6 n=1 Tax=Striga asiatica TaxID=4170 RepID=A0A5A7PF00_STRAF|nr:G-box regulating factor 6 [Striga asiatica]
MINSVKQKVDVQRNMRTTRQFGDWLRGCFGGFGEHKEKRSSSPSSNHLEIKSSKAGDQRIEAYAGGDPPPPPDLPSLFPAHQPLMNPPTSFTTPPLPLLQSNLLEQPSTRTHLPRPPSSISLAELTSLISAEVAKVLQNLLPASSRLEEGEIPTSSSDNSISFFIKPNRDTSESLASVPPAGDGETSLQNLTFPLQGSGEITAAVDVHPAGPTDLDLSLGRSLGDDRLHSSTGSRSSLADLVKHITPPNPNLQLSIRSPQLKIGPPVRASSTPLTGPDHIGPNPRPKFSAQPLGFPNLNPWPIQPSPLLVQPATFHLPQSITSAQPRTTISAQHPQLDISTQNHSQDIATPKSHTISNPSKADTYLLQLTGPSHPTFGGAGDGATAGNHQPADNHGGNSLQANKPTKGLSFGLKPAGTGSKIGKLSPPNVLPSESLTMAAATSGLNGQQKNPSAPHLFSGISLLSPTLTGNPEPAHMDPTRAVRRWQNNGAWSRTVSKKNDKRKKERKGEGKEMRKKIYL